MTNIFQSLLLAMASATHKELARQVKYLKVENEILRNRLPKRIYCTPKEKSRLVRFAMKVGRHIWHLPSIVAPGTLLNWIRAERKHKRPYAKRGRPRTPEQVRRLILKLAKENQWGYTRILGELKNLGIKSLSRNTVKRILKLAGYDPGPNRGEGTWDEFLQQHAASLWQCDFFSKWIVTWKGFRHVFVLAFLNVKTRQVVLSPATLNPDKAWVAAQAESFVKEARGRGLPVAMVQRDRDKKFAPAFDLALRRCRVRLKQNAFRSPNTNAYVERFVQSIQQECLDRFVVFGEKHMTHICKEYLAHYREERPHQALDNLTVVRQKKRGRPKATKTRLADEAVPLAEVRCRQRLGGLLKSYSRAA